MSSPSGIHNQTPQSIPPKRSGILNPLSMPSRWLHMYDDFITKNAHQVSQIESTLRSLTYIIPGTISSFTQVRNLANDQLTLGVCF
jgi:peroxin-16